MLVTGSVTIDSATSGTIWVIWASGFGGTSRECKLAGCIMVLSESREARQTEEAFHLTSL